MRNGEVVGADGMTASEREAARKAQEAEDAKFAAQQKKASKQQAAADAAQAEADRKAAAKAAAAKAPKQFADAVAGLADSAGNAAMKKNGDVKTKLGNGDAPTSLPQKMDKDDKDKTLPGDLDDSDLPPSQRR